jgi:hypothetical protein
MCGRATKRERERNKSKINVNGSSEKKPHHHFCSLKSHLHPQALEPSSFYHHIDASPSI